LTEAYSHHEYIVIDGIHDVVLRLYLLRTVNGCFLKHTHMYYMTDLLNTVVRVDRLILCTVIVCLCK